MWVGVRGFPSTTSRSQGSVPITGNGPAGAPELPHGWWQDRGWSWGCAAEFAGARRLLAGDGAWQVTVSGQPIEAWGRLRQTLLCPGAAWAAAQAALGGQSFTQAGRTFPSPARCWGCLLGAEGSPCVQQSPGQGQGPGVPVPGPAGAGRSRCAMAGSWLAPWPCKAASFSTLLLCLGQS